MQESYGNAPVGSRSAWAWTTWGVRDWNHATEIFKQHACLQWYSDAVAIAVISEQAESGSSAIELQCSSAAREAAKQ